MASPEVFTTATPTRQLYDLNEVTRMTAVGSANKESPCLTNVSSPVPSQDTETAASSSPRHYGFTPQRVRTLPRAWERRPATPYIARNDAQKIWKRVPLGIVAANEQSWRMETRKLITRPVKRLRVTQLDGADDKENVGYVGVKWEDDGTVTSSPKRKAPIQIPAETNANGGELDSSDDLADEENAQDVEPQLSSSVCDLIGNAESSDDAGSAPRKDHLSIPVAGEIIDTASEADSEQQVSTPTLNADFTSDKETTLTVLGFTASEHLDTPAASGVALDAPAEKSSSQQSLSEAQLPETTLPPDSAAFDDEGRTMDSITSKLAEPDDTAYLHEFLSRARAQKAAKQQIIPTEPESSSSPTEVAGTNDGSSKQVEEEGVAFAKNDPEMINLPPMQETDVPISPRRSSRLTTRIPRPQKPAAAPPSTIPLKRLNGTEFIATQREMQSIALATRTNTKQNKGPAISVKMRLLQLDAEAKVRPAEDGPTEGKRRKKKTTTAKEVTWDTMLVKFQDGTSASCMPGGASDDEATEDLLAEKQEATDEATQNATRAGRRVRKLRKSSVGSVNGTPAPKRLSMSNIPVVEMRPAVSSSVAPSSEEKFVNAMKEWVASEVREADEKQRQQDQAPTRTRTRRSRGPQ